MTTPAQIDNVVRALTLVGEACLRTATPASGAAFAPMVVGVADTRQDLVLCESNTRRSSVRFVLERGADVAVLLYDGYITEYDRADPCPDCLGVDGLTADAGCATCRGGGGTSRDGRRDAIIILTFVRSGRRVDIQTKRYARTATGAVLFEAPITTECYDSTRQWSSFQGIFDGLE